MPQFRLGAVNPPVGTNAGDAGIDRQPAGGRGVLRGEADTVDSGGTGISDPSASTDPVIPGGHSTRDFERTFDTSAGVPGPMGLMNTGYVHNVVSTNGQWSRGELPDLGYGYAFALRRPKFMREPRTDLGSYNLARG